MESEQYEEFKGVNASLKGKWTGKTHHFDYDPTQLLKAVIATSTSFENYFFFKTE
jgi:hypothetical protein